MSIYKRFWATFLIGATAGIAPFLFMQLLPALLSPESGLVRANLSAMILTGILVGIITVIMFAKDFTSSQPRDVFVYALGVPAVLLATVSNVGTQFNASKKVSEAREQASSALVAPPPQPETIHQQPRQLTPTAGDSTRTQHGVALWTKAPGYGPDGPQDVTYFVIIGQYSSSSQALTDYARYQNLQLRTERYVAKNLGVFEIGTGAYVLVYASYASEDEARKTYQLLRINDPDLSVRILKSDSARQSGPERVG